MVRSEGATLGLAELVLDLARGELASESVRCAQEAILDQVGVQLASTTLDWNQVAYQVAKDTAGSPGAADAATVVGFGDRLPYPAAAYINGLLGHGCEWDDVVPAADHPGSAVIPAVLAVGEVMHSSGDQVLRAVIAAYEAMARVGRSVRPSILHRGFHPHGVLGPVASTAGVAVLMGLDAEELARAFAFAANRSGGLMEYGVSGGEIKRLLGGPAVRNGIDAVLMAKTGYPAPASIFEGSRGFCQAFSNEPKPELILDNSFGADYIQTIAHKLRPCAWPVHGSVDAIEKLLADHGFDWRAVREVRIGVSPTTIITGWGQIFEPRDVCSAQFSIPFSVGMAAVLRSNSLDTYADPKTLSDPDVLDFARKVVVHPDERAVGEQRFFADLELVLDDGSSLTHTQVHPVGSEAWPLSHETLVEKYRSGAGLALEPEAVEALLDVCERFGSLADVGELVALTVR